MGTDSTELSSAISRNESTSTCSAQLAEGSMRRTSGNNFDEFNTLVLDGHGVNNRRHFFAGAAPARSEVNANQVLIVNQNLGQGLDAHEMNRLASGFKLPHCRTLQEMQGLKRACERMQKMTRMRSQSTSKPTALHRQPCPAVPITFD